MRFRRAHPQRRDGRVVVGIGDRVGHRALARTHLAAQQLGTAALNTRPALMGGDPRTAHLIELVVAIQRHTLSLRRPKGVSVHYFRLVVAL
jgi:hypothetical protein